MKRDTLIKHKKVVIVCNESGLVSKSCNDTLTKYNNQNIW
jgi:hypothetical protein